MTERMKNIDVALVYELWKEYADSCHSGDLEQWMSLWIDDGIQMVPDAPTRAGKEQIRKAMQLAFDLFETHNMFFQTEEVRILGNWAYSHGTFTFEMTPKEGGKTTKYWGKFLDIVAKQVDGSWKISIDCQSYNEPQGGIGAVGQDSYEEKT